MPTTNPTHSNFPPQSFSPPQSPTHHRSVPRAPPTPPRSFRSVLSLLSDVPHNAASDLRASAPLLFYICVSFFLFPIIGLIMPQTFVFRSILAITSTAVRFHLAVLSRLVAARLTRDDAATMAAIHSSVNHMLGSSCAKRQSQSNATLHTLASLYKYEFDNTPKKDANGRTIAESAAKRGSLSRLNLLAARALTPTPLEDDSSDSLGRGLGNWRYHSFSLSRRLSRALLNPSNHYVTTPSSPFYLLDRFFARRRFLLLLLVTLGCFSVVLCRWLLTIPFIKKYLILISVTAPSLTYLYSLCGFGDNGGSSAAFSSSTSSSSPTPAGFSSRPILSLRRSTAYSSRLLLTSLGLRPLFDEDTNAEFTAHAVCLIGLVLLVGYEQPQAVYSGYFERLFDVAYEQVFPAVCCVCVCEGVRQGVLLNSHEVVGEGVERRSKEEGTTGKEEGGEKKREDGGKERGREGKGKGEKTFTERDPLGWGWEGREDRRDEDDAVGFDLDDD